MKRIFRISATLSLAVAALLGGGVSASAHTDGFTSSPETGSTVDAGRIPITITFGEELLVGDDSISHEVVVTNAEGEIIPALCASAEGFDLSTAAAIDQPGEYTVTWRTVSADGHPTSGDFKFNVVNNNDYDAASDPVDACIYAMATSGEEPTLITMQQEDAESDAAVKGAFFIGLSVMAVLAVIAIATRKTIKDWAVTARASSRKRKSE
jgi:methionine-rich copper-binding protein CopC